MRKVTKIFYLLVVVPMLLGACGTAPAASAAQSASLPAATTQPVSMNQAASATPESSGTLNTNYDNAVSVPLQLLAGTFKLDGTDLAVTKDQASQLLPLWTNLQTLSQANMPGQGQANSTPQATPQAQAKGTQTQQQMDALVTQIEAAMTPEQIKAIADMKITPDTVKEVMQAQGITLRGPQGASGTPQAGGQGNGQPPSGTPPAGGPQGGGAGNGQGSSGTPPAGRQQGSGQPPSGGPGNSGFVPQELVKALAQYLQKAAGG